jgi:hypothetical protein
VPQGATPVSDAATSIPSDGGTSACGNCASGQACNPTSNVCEASPGGGAIRTDLVGKEMSVGVSNNGDGPPQGAREAHLDFNWQRSTTNAIVAVAVPPGSITIDGADTSATEWHGVPLTTVDIDRASALLPAARRSNGTAYDITSEDYGVTEMKIGAAYDGSSIYFRVEWQDPTENDARGRWLWNGAKWVRDTATTQPLPTGNLATARAVTASEDKVQLLFNINIPGFFGDNGGLGAGCAGLCHLEGLNGQRIATATVGDGGTTFLAGGGLMHTNGAGQKVDVWQWKATRTGPLHIYDDQVIDETTRHGDGNQSDDFRLTKGDCSAKATDSARYTDVDASVTELHFTNEYFDPTKDAGCPSLGPSRVPAPYLAGTSQMYEDNSPFIARGGAATAFLEGTFTPTTGDTIPGFIWRTQASTAVCLRCQNEAEGHWTAGKWVVEIRRSLVAPDADDVDFTIEQH